MAEKIFGAKQEKVVSAPPGRACTPRQSKSLIFEEIGEIWTVGVVNLVALACFEACVLRATIKRVVRFWGKKSAAQRKSWLRLCVQCKGNQCDMNHEGRF